MMISKEKERSIAMLPCTLCPHLCGARRAAGEVGHCRSTDEIRIARAAPHHFEEPPISGTKGSGTVFFVGCSLSCLFCQNKSISRGNAGHAVNEAALADTLLSLADTGVHNLNLVTGTHFTPQIARVLEKIKPRLQIPVVWNSSGYECVETLRLLDGLVDIYLPDFKYSDDTLARTYSGAPDYAAHATAAIREMYRQTGAVFFDNEGLLKKGTVIRHLVLPGCRLDSLAVLEKMEYVERRRSDSDRRITLVYPTEKAVSSCDKIRVAFREWNEYINAAFTEEEAKQFILLFEKAARRAAEYAETELDGVDFSEEDGGEEK